VSGLSAQPIENNPELHEVRDTTAPQDRKPLFHICILGQFGVTASKFHPALERAVTLKPYHPSLHAIPRILRYFLQILLLSQRFSSVVITMPVTALVTFAQTDSPARSVPPD